MVNCKNHGIYALICLKCKNITLDKLNTASIPDGMLIVVIIVNFQTIFHMNNRSDESALFKQYYIDCNKKNHKMLHKEQPPVPVLIINFFGVKDLKLI